MKRLEWRSAGAFAFMVVTSMACSDSTSPGSLQLTGPQAQAIIARASQLASGRPELSWLADSLELVIHSGTTLKQVGIGIDGVGKSYYAVALNRQIIYTGNPPSSFATFHLIAFDDPTDPSRFVIVNGFAPSNTATPPTTVSGSFASSAASGHIMEAGTTAVLDWVAATGTATFTAGAQGAACDGFVAANGITCFASSLTLSFNIIATQPPSPLAPMKTAVLESVDIPGVLLRIQPTL